MNGKFRICLLLFGTLSTFNMQGAENDFCSLNPKALEEKINSTELLPIIERLEQDATKLLNKKPPSVMEKTKAGQSGNKHDYFSLSIYWWPNNLTPNGLPYIQKDGERNPEADQLDGPRIFRLGSEVLTLSLAYYYTSNEAFAEKAIEYLDTWFLNPNTKMNPHLKYGQSIPGLLPGARQGIIETVTYAKDVIDSIGMLRSSSTWNEEMESALKSWFKEYYKWLDTSLLGWLESRRDNNHGTYFDLQVACYQRYVGDDKAAKDHITKYSFKRIDNQFDRNGKQEKELARTKSWDYSVYNLQAWFRLATLANKYNIDLWNYKGNKGQSLEKGLEFLASFVGRMEEWPYEQIKNVNLSGLKVLLFEAKSHYPNNPMIQAAFTKLENDSMPGSGDRFRILY